VRTVKTKAETRKSKNRGFRAKIRLVSKLAVLFVIIVVGALTNWAVALALLIVLNGKVLWSTTFGRLPLQVDQSSFDGPKTFEYTSTDKTLSIDLYYPARLRTDRREHFPLVVFAHGGGWIGGSRKQIKNVSWCELLASRGLAVASVDYRFAYAHGLSDILGDYSNALEFLKENATSLRIDKSRIVLMGLSAGGHLSLLYACRNSSEGNNEAIEGIRGVVAWYAPCDLMDIWSDDNESLFARIGSALAIGGPPSRREEDYKRHSPINWVSRHMVPTFLVHGARDQVIPASSSLKMYRKLKEESVQAYLKVEIEGGHGFDIERKSARTIKYIEQTIAFVKRQVTTHSRVSGVKSGTHG